MSDHQEAESLVERLRKLTPEQRADIEAHISGLTLDAETYDSPRHGWTCFHCGETFKTEAGARLHFGEKVTGRPACEVLYPFIEAAKAADRADWLVTTWAVDVADLRRLREAADRLTLLEKAGEGTGASNASPSAALHGANLDAEPSAPFQARVEPWMRECFGDVIPFDRVERADRLLEEVFELLQSGGYDPARVTELRDYVWGRPVGEPAQELGGVMVTLAAYSLAFGLDIHEAGETELARIWTKVPQIRAKQASKPRGIACPIGPENA